jgi:hypothetical protein
VDVPQDTIENGWERFRAELIESDSGVRYCRADLRQSYYRGAYQALLCLGARCKDEGIRAAYIGLTNEISEYAHKLLDSP